MTDIRAKIGASGASMVAASLRSVRDGYCQDIEGAIEMIGRVCQAHSVDLAEVLTAYEIPGGVDQLREIHRTTPQKPASQTRGPSVDAAVLALNI